MCCISSLKKYCSISRGEKMPRRPTWREISLPCPHKPLCHSFLNLLKERGCPWRLGDHRWGTLQSFCVIPWGPHPFCCSDFGRRSQSMAGFVLSTAWSSPVQAPLGSLKKEHLVGAALDQKPTRSGSSGFPL